jgi:hypothetical protein
MKARIARGRKVRLSTFLAFPPSDLLSFPAVAVLLLLVSEVVGCGGLFQKDKAAEVSYDSAPAVLRVVPRSGKEVADLSANDIVRIMQRIGFTDGQILDLGTPLHNALLQSGAAEIVAGNRPQVVFAVNGEYVYIQSPLRGTFVYGLASGRFGLPTPPARAPTSSAPAPRTR